jgi:putative membrane protein
MPLMITLHIAFLIIWSASLLYLPHLFVHQALTKDAESRKQAIVMQRMLYALIMTPSALLTVLAGGWLVFERGFSGGWLHVKLTLVLLMVFFHAYCGALMVHLRHHRFIHPLAVYRMLPAVPALLITGVVTLVVAKPF